MAQDQSGEFGRTVLPTARGTDPQYPLGLAARGFYFPSPTVRRLAMLAAMLMVTGLGCYRLWISRTFDGDALAFYVPPATDVANGDFSALSHPLIQPAYPLLSGLASHLVRWTNYPVQYGSQLVVLAFFIILVPIVYSLTKAMFGPLVALHGAAFAACNPLATRFSARIGTELMFTVAITAVFRLLLWNNRRRSTASAAALGAMMATGPGSSAPRDG